MKQSNRAALAGAAVCAAVLLGGGRSPVAAAPASSSSGALTRIGPKEDTGAGCPLKHTAVRAEIAGFLARVTVTQQFENPFPEAIEAVYTFPLPQEAAVDDMTLEIGDRVVRGLIKRREEARAIYEAARSRGQLAGLLDQDRPNIFVQSVANIPPRAKVNVKISYVELLPYEAGRYEFVFPMVVGPRYNPRGAAGMPSAPPVTPKGTRAGHDISIEVALNAGLPVDLVESPTHEIDVLAKGERTALLRLKNLKELPNKDFILRYDVAGRRIANALLAHRDPRGGFFTLILQPPERVAPAEATPKELVFVLDTSGSMSGFPIEKAKETMSLALAALNPRDTFNLITFAGDTHVLFPQPVPATAENLAKAQEFLASRRGGGGTEMMKAIRAALEPTARQDHVRVVCFMTDGYVGNDMEILAEIRKYSSARVFSFGIGSSVNRFLLDKMAQEGRGEVQYVGLQDDGSAAARRFHERVHNPLLTDIEIDWAGLPITDVYPRRILDLFGAKPVVVTGRYTAGARGEIRLRGKLGGRPYAESIRVNFPSEEAKNDTIATLWARTKITDLMSQDWTGTQHGAPRGDIKEEITKLGLDYKLMTQFTSFVAVEEKIVTEGGVPRRIEVPVEMPEGVSYEGIFGEAKVKEASMAAQFRGTAPASIMAPLMSRDEAVSPRINLPPARVDLKVEEPGSKFAPEIAMLVASHSAGDVEIRVYVNDASEATLRRLKDAGFTLIARPGNGKLLVGRIAAAKLEALARIPAVRYIAPRA